MSIRYKVFDTEIKQDLEPSSRRMSFTISTWAVDRDGDTIDPKGWDTTAYMKNPCVLWAHSYDQLPVAKATRVFQTTTGLHAEIEFPEPGVYPFADTVHDMLKAGFLNATSVGFAPSESVKSKDRQNGYDFTKQELLEFSIVPVPCNPQALVEQRGLSHAQVNIWAKAVQQWANDNQPIALKAATKIYKHLTIDTPTFPAFERDYLVETEDGKKAMDEDRLVKLLALHDLVPKMDMDVPYRMDFMRDIYESAMSALRAAQDASDCCEACLPAETMKSLDQAHIDKIKQGHDSANRAVSSIKYIARTAHDQMLNSKSMQAVTEVGQGEKASFISKNVLDLVAVSSSEIDWESLEEETGFSIEGKDLDALFLSIVRPTLKEMATAQVRDAMNALTGRVD